MICSREVEVNNCVTNSWNIISFESVKINRNEEYNLILQGDDLSCIFLETCNEVPDILNLCSIDGEETTYTLAIGITETYKYIKLGYLLQLLVSIFFALVMMVALCYSVMNIEKLYLSYAKCSNNKGFLYAVFFSVYTMFMYNPIEKIRNEVDEFVRVMGGAFNAGLDVSKRISSFGKWFICFAIAFVLFFSL